METYKDKKSECRKTIIKILTKGLSRVVDSLDKSSDINNLEENKNSQFVDYLVDKKENKSVSKAHEN